MSDKPTYLGLLNAIANAEGNAHSYLCAWAEVTPSDDVRAVLRKVAAREGEHAMSFARRINELGYDVRPKGAEENAKAIALVTSDCSDLEKMEALKLHRLDRGDEPDIFDDFFRDHSIDIATGELLGRYIAEERDTARVPPAVSRAVVRGGRRPGTVPARTATTAWRRWNARSTLCAVRSRSCATRCRPCRPAPTAPRRSPARNSGGEVAEHAAGRSRSG